MQKHSKISPALTEQPEMLRKGFLPRHLRTFAVRYAMQEALCNPLISPAGPGAVRFCESGSRFPTLPPHMAARAWHKKRKEPFARSRGRRMAADAFRVSCQAASKSIAADFVGKKNYLTQEVFCKIIASVDKCRHACGPDWSAACCVIVLDLRHAHEDNDIGRRFAL